MKTRLSARIALSACILVLSTVSQGQPLPPPPPGPGHPPALAYQTLVSLDVVSGTAPAGQLVQVEEKVFWGTAQYGGQNNVGTVFAVTEEGKSRVVHAFIQDGNDGYLPSAPLMVDRKGDVYGTTTAGGHNYQGTIFRITRKGVYSVIHSFEGGPFDGSQSYAPLVQTEDGRMFGTTAFGGANGQGVVFELDGHGVVRVLHDFDGVGGGIPQWGLTVGRNGVLYGTTVAGGEGGAGTLYRITPSGAFSVLHSFGVTGVAPASLVLGRNGDLYGTTSMGGPANGGTVFSFRPSTGVVNVIHAFAQTTPGGDSPIGVIQGKDGNLYGTTSNYSSDFRGTVYRLTISGQLTTLHTFSPGSAAFPYDGSLPLSPPLQARNGALYGTTSQGGVPGLSPGDGSVYRIRLPVGE